MNIENLKKVELHLHLDGSLRPQTLLDIAEKDNISLPTKDLEEIKKYMMVADNNKDLVEYLKKFELPLKVMQSEENLERIAFELVEDLAKENYMYAEIRFAPHLHTEKGLSLDKVIKSVTNGIERAERNYDIKSNIILCIMRHLNVEKGFEIVNLAKSYMGSKVVAIDLAGDEFNYPVTIFKDVFAKAKENNIPITIHAGEARGYESIVDSIKLGASRIGHGVRAYENTNLIQELINKNIFLECCAISNMNTQIFDDFYEYPFKNYLNKGIKVTINTDNRTVSNTNFKKEVEVLEKYNSIDKNEIIKSIKNSIYGAFISDKEKDILLKKLDFSCN